jgi:hypothetical protein
LKGAGEEKMVPKGMEEKEAQAKTMNAFHFPHFGPNNCRQNQKKIKQNLKGILCK